MDKSNSYETPNRRSEQKVLKQGLRIKTVHNSTNIKKNIPRKLLRHKSVEEKSLSLYANTFALIPSFKTPPADQKKSLVNNPFNVGLRERLECSTVSPNVFSNVLSPSQSCQEMRWTIEDLSTMKPVPIEENVEPVSEPDDPRVQEAIDKYFSETHMVPSPLDAPLNWLPRESMGTPVLSKISGQAVASTPRVDLYHTVHTRDVLVQTDLSLPAVLPEHVEAVLKPYFNTINKEEAEENDFNISSMRRKLFFHKDEEKLSPVKCNNEPGLQKTEQFTPANSSQSRHFTPFAGSSQEEIEPDISPISMERSSINVSKSKTKLEFPENLDDPFSKELPYEHTDVDIVMDANDLIDEPMKISIIDISKLHRSKKQRTSSDEDVGKPFTSTICNDKNSQSANGNPSLFEDMGYYTNEDMSWRQTLQVTNNKYNVVSSLPNPFLAASTPTKNQTKDFC